MRVESQERSLFASNRSWIERNKSRALASQVRTNQQNSLVGSRRAREEDETGRSKPNSRKMRTSDQSKSHAAAPKSASLRRSFPNNCFDLKALRAVLKVRFAITNQMSGTTSGTPNTLGSKKSV